MKSRIIILALAILLLPLALLNAKDKEIKVEVKYFHATIRCEGCLKNEANITNALNLSFKNELKDKKINFVSLDFLQPENEHYQDDYKFDAQTLVIVKKIDGKEIEWKKLDKIWDYADDFTKFKKYIEDEINEYLKIN